MKTSFKGVINGEEFSTVQEYNKKLTELIEAGEEVSANSNTSVTYEPEQKCEEHECCGDCESEGHCCCGCGTPESSSISNDEYLSLLNELLETDKFDAFFTSVDSNFLDEETLVRIEHLAEANVHPDERHNGWDDATYREYYSKLNNLYESLESMFTDATGQEYLDNIRSKIQDQEGIRDTLIGNLRVSSQAGVNHFLTYADNWEEKDWDFIEKRIAFRNNTKKQLAEVNHRLAHLRTTGAKVFQIVYVIKKLYEIYDCEVGKTPQVMTSGKTTVQQHEGAITQLFSDEFCENVISHTMKIAHCSRAEAETAVLSVINTFKKHPEEWEAFVKDQLNKKEFLTYLG